MTTLTTNGQALNGAAAPPPPPAVADGEVRFEHGWRDRGIIEIVAAFDPAAADTQAEQLLSTARAKLQATAAKVRKHPSQKEAARLAEALAENVRQRSAAESKARDALAAARQSLADGKDPAAHEEAARQARLDSEVFGNRCTQLQTMSDQAKARAQRIVGNALDATWREAVADVTRRRAKVLADISVALGPLLPALLAIDQAAEQLVHPRTGGLPEWAEDLLADATT